MTIDKKYQGRGHAQSNSILTPLEMPQSIKPGGQLSINN